MKRIAAGISLSTLMIFTSSIASSAWAIDSQTAVRAANLWTRISYPGDAHEEYQRAQHVHVADLNADGRDEVVYLQRVTCHGPAHDCTNEVSVLTTPIPPNSWVLKSPDPFLTMFEDTRQSIIKLGYDRDAYLQIPGDIEKLVIVGSTIRVTFMASLESNACHRPYRQLDGSMSESTDPCPPPGRYVWNLQWTPGELKHSPPEKDAAMAGPAKAVLSAPVLP